MPYGRRYAGERGARRPVRFGRAWRDRPTVRQWEAVAICCQAVVNLSTRYAQAAARMAGAPVDDAGRAELERVAAVCRRVPGLPARTFHEALQSVWFVDFVLHTVYRPRILAGHVRRGASRSQYRDVQRRQRDRVADESRLGDQEGGLRGRLAFTWRIA